MAPLQVGDHVELVSVPPGCERRLKVGQRGTVVVGSDQEFGWCSVAFTQADGAVYLLAPRHLRLIARPRRP